MENVIDDFEDEMLDEYLDDQELLQAAVEVEDCHCGAKRLGNDGQVCLVADCCC